jgi:hypothetical protein
MTSTAKTALGHNTDKWDGVFYVDMPSFFKCFSDTQVGYYDDWKRYTKDATWDRSTYNSYEMSNPVTQDAMVGFQVNADRLFPYGCDVKEMKEYISFNLVNSSGQTVTDDYGNTKIDMSWEGQAWGFYNNLPAGDYTIKHINSWYS